MLYFAYGSNMDWDQIKERCPSAGFFSAAKLKDHRLAFSRKSEIRGCGSADAIPEQGQNVWGVIYQIDEEDFGQLDAAEDIIPGRAQNGYKRQQHYVYTNGEDGQPLLVSLYFAEKQKNPPLPNAEYKRLIVEGAKYWKLPEDYIEELEQIKIAL